jgi:hypothetical protein
MYFLLLFGGQRQPCRQRGGKRQRSACCEVARFSQECDQERNFGTLIILQVL